MQTNGHVEHEEWSAAPADYVAPVQGDAPAPAPPERRVATGAELTPAVLTYLQQAAGSLFNGRAVSLQQAWDGDDHLLWRVGVEGFEGAAVLKLFVDAGLARGRRTLDAHERFATAGLAPRSFWFDRAPEGLPEPLLVYGWVEGEPLAGADDEILLVDAAARIHGSSPAGINRYGTQPLSLHSWLELQRVSVAGLAPWLGAHDPAVAASFATLARHALAAAADALPLWNDAHLRPVHGDLFPANAVRTAGGAAPVLLLDWEHYGLGDPAREAARLVHACAPQDQVETWLERYLAPLQSALPGLAARVAVWRRLLAFEALADLLTTLRTAPPALDARTAAEVAQLLDLLHSSAGQTLDAPGRPDEARYAALLARGVQ